MARIQSVAYRKHSKRVSYLLQLIAFYLICYLNSIGSQLESTVCEHLDEDIWANTCRFLQHDPNLRGRNFCVKIPGLSRQLLPVQAHGVFTILSRHHSVHGSIFLAHVMGIGKSTMIIATHHVQWVFNLIWNDIQKNPDRHCNKEIACSSALRIQEKYGFVCPCDPNSPTHFVKPSQGSSLLFVPISLLRTWKHELSECYSADGLDSYTTGANRFGTRFVFAYGGSFSWTPELRKAVCPIEEPRKDEAGNPIPPRIKAKLSNSSVMIITSSNSFPTQVIKKLTVRVEYLPTRRSRTLVFKGDYVQLAIGSFYRDEAHMERKDTSLTIRRLMEIQNLMARPLYPNFPLRLTIASGTPLTTGPIDIAYYVSAMVRPEWRQHRVLRKWMKKEAIELGISWDEMCKNGNVTLDDAQDMVRRFRPLVEELMLRFTTKSDFLGAGPVVEVPKSKYDDIMCKHSDNWQSRLADQKSQEDAEKAVKEAEHRARWIRRYKTDTNYKPMAPSNYYRSRLYASFPALMDIKDSDDNTLRLTAKEWEEKTKNGEWVQEDTDPFFLDIKAISQSSAKLSAIHQKINAFKNKTDSKDRPCRMIFASVFHVGTYIIYLVSK
jgi:hypothetical protein